MIDIGRELQVVLNTGKIAIGSNRAMKTIINGSAKLAILAANAPAEIRQEVEYYANLNRTPVFVYPGSSWELGAAMRKPYKVALLAVLEPGESNILELIR
ncbi:50S ribosomal protein L30e [Thermocladium modestius]|uniref:Large ribosomal subunit protein eL30 n=1 Tax=Thermocladium modestius TaxID=62609 RepID=A0A830GV25_9CREN|nr:50S ribosomal protein L30e [Thermocladium modestius]GGP20193.1 50S ribosomal protein L30e [Thermocladium modestius]